MNAITSRLALGGAAAIAAVSVAACSTSPSSPSASGDSSKAGGGTSSSSAQGAAEGGSAKAGGAAVQVVAAENFWGSIASQLGGSHVKVTSIIDNPSADPHDYEPTAADARTVAGARLAIVNGIGYDSWAGKLLSANPAQDRTDLEVGKLAGIPANGNPHRWYSPDNVHQVVEQITADYKKIDPADAADFDQLKNTFENTTLAPYTKEIADIRATYAGTPVGASESIFAPLAQGLGLDLVTPESFLDAISEGTDPTAKDKTTIDRQIAEKKIKVYVYNSQNATPDVQAQVKAAKAKGIPVATVTETLTPAGASFQDWQVRQLKGIQAALAKATGK
ncbi:metal ABC transporter solute-binding protein, Zn/Mn family [Streptomyces fuscigenes]|uniref:metal ABC transporter solute-binding protein, Zn/Mn family n=1 Tax=Streptomyces fuscigenes TaxID=1528880 RepID=UPI001F25C2AC|nr:zinc ABC transporter substrate-binding protein [Streptomyces fuscigenes]MCF3960585.1 zinc ABC transporter substrate-binding protein [Streptomyces fuscigenes]